MKNNPALMTSQNTELFLESIEKGDTELALKLLEQFNREKDSILFNQIGKMTRTVHDAIVNFHIETTSKLDKNPEKISKMVDASDRLQFVIKTTENAANKTMDMIENSLPISESLSKQAEALQIKWRNFLEKNISFSKENETLFFEVNEFFSRTKVDTGAIEKNLTEILMAQDFQDITGQVLKKVISLVRDVEENLVDLVKMSAGLQVLPEKSSAFIEIKEQNKPIDYHADLEGPVMDKSRTDVVTNQDEVDDLLSSLGF